MRAFTDYDYYKNTYKGELDETEYDKKVKTAFDEIVYQTNSRALNASETMKDKIKDCECSLIDALVEIDENATISGVVSSVSNDGYSVSYGSTKGRNRDEIIREKARNLCFRMLTSPENLMCRWM